MFRFMFRKNGDIQTILHIFILEFYNINKILFII